MSEGLKYEAFSYDVFLACTESDATVAREIAHRLRSDGLVVRLDNRALSLKTQKRGGDMASLLSESRTLLLCFSQNVDDVAWERLEPHTLQFRDPSIVERRLVAIRFDDKELPSSLSYMPALIWEDGNEDLIYRKVLAACRPSIDFLARPQKTIEDGDTLACSYSADAKLILTGGGAGQVRLYDALDSHLIWERSEGTAPVWSVACNRDRRLGLSGSHDSAVRVWDISEGRLTKVLVGHRSNVTSLVLPSSGNQAISGSDDQTVRLWNLDTGECVTTLDIGEEVWGLDLSSDGWHLIVGTRQNSVQLWELKEGRRLQVLEGHTGQLRTVAFSRDGRFCVSGGEDGSIRLWGLTSGRCLQILQAFSGYVWSLKWSPDDNWILAGGSEEWVQLWHVQTGISWRIQMSNDEETVRGVSWSPDGTCIHCLNTLGALRSWTISEFVALAERREGLVVSPDEHGDQLTYTNAKVLLIGESGVGKTGLSRRLALDSWEPSDSTVGAWATQWKIEVSSVGNIEREIWLWDFGGQSDQRLVHQLYMNDAAVAVLVFDGQKEDVFETLGQWDRDLSRVAASTVTKLLVAGRIDAGGLRASRHRIDEFAKERGFSRFVETSAKANVGCETLRAAILEGIKWERLPWRSSPLLFKLLKDEIIRIKDSGRVLVRFSELRDALRLALSPLAPSFDETTLRSVIGLLTGPGVVSELGFGGWILLQPERINAYAQAVIQTMRKDHLERGCLPEEQVLGGHLEYRSSLDRLDVEEERIILLAMHKTLVEHGLCLREYTDSGTLLVFPSYYRRERPELTGHPAVLVSYRFAGFLDDVYATLVVKLHHTKAFEQDQLWRYAADFRTVTGKQLGAKLLRKSDGIGELEIYFDPTIPLEEKIIFSRYVHEHLLQKAEGVTRFRHYVCPHCGTPVGNREVAMQKLEEGKKDLPCINCDEPSKRVPLWDEMEELFASPDVQKRVHALERESRIVLDNESKERALVGDVISTVALAGQLSRELIVSDHGIDMEIEFKDNKGRATGAKLYLQLKSGESYRRKRQRDGAEVFAVRKQRHIDYWIAQQFPVFLVVRNSEGEIQWMEIRELLRRESDDGKKPVRQIIFQGERFDVMSVQRWRERILGSRK